MSHFCFPVLFSKRRRPWAMGRVSTALHRADHPEDHRHTGSKCSHQKAHIDEVRHRNLQGLIPAKKILKVGWLMKCSVVDGYIYICYIYIQYNKIRHLYIYYIYILDIIYIIL